MSEDIKQSNSQEETPSKQEIARDGKGQFVPGQSGNPNGRPKELSIVAALKRMLDKTPEGKDKKYLDMLVERVLKIGIADGNVQMLKDIIDRVDGRAKSKIDIGVDREEVQELTEFFRAMGNFKPKPKPKEEVKKDEN